MPISLRIVSISGPTAVIGDRSVVAIMTIPSSSTAAFTPVDAAGSVFC
ncbi:hypothetical protein VQ056_16970 [Paenibacillus sp. JTLBN-2024]